MICPIPDLIFAGYRNGSIKVWHIASTGVQFSCNSDLDLPDVRALDYSDANKLIVAGYDKKEN